MVVFFSVAANCFSSHVDAVQLCRMYSCAKCADVSLNIIYTLYHRHNTQNARYFEVQVALLLRFSSVVVVVVVVVSLSECKQITCTLQRAQNNIPYSEFEKLKLIVAFDMTNNRDKLHQMYNFQFN